MPPLRCRFGFKSDSNIAPKIGGLISRQLKVIN